MIAVLFILGLLLLVIFAGIAIYNRLIKLRNTVKSSWSDIDVQLKKRYDLVPNLVETVKGYAKHEKEIFENIAEARTKYFQAKTTKEKIEASNALEGVLSGTVTFTRAERGISSTQGE